MAIYRKKPVNVEAFRLGHDRYPEWFGALIADGTVQLNLYQDEERIEGVANIRTLEGVMTAEAGCYVVRGVKGEVYPVREDIFLDTYERVGKPARRYTEEEIEAKRTPKGGFTKKGLEELGVLWPPKHGWKKLLLRGEDPN